MSMKWRNAALAALVGMGMVALAPAAMAQQQTVRELLRIPQGCYPVAINPTTEEINNVCRGNAGWTPDGLQLFNSLKADNLNDGGYMNKKTGRPAALLEDLRSGVGPVLWFEYYWLPYLDTRNIPRPR
jgi:hypothetical protein